MSHRSNSVRVLGSISAKKPRLFRLRHGHRELLLGSGTVTLGRRATCDYVLNDNQVSREHARFIVGEQTIAIEDMNSANGVFVNDEPIRGLKRLESGDRLRIGSQNFEVLQVTETEVEEDDSPDMTVVSRKSSAPSSSSLQDEDWEDRPTTVVNRK